MFGVDPKAIGELVEKLEQLGNEYLVELRRLNDNLEALRRDGIPERSVPRMTVPDPMADLPS